MENISRWIWKSIFPLFLHPMSTTTVFTSIYPFVSWHTQYIVCVLLLVIYSALEAKALQGISPHNSEVEPFLPLLDSTHSTTSRHITFCSSPSLERSIEQQNSQLLYPNQPVSFLPMDFNEALTIFFQFRKYSEWLKTFFYSIFSRRFFTIFFLLLFTFAPQNWE